MKHYLVRTEETTIVTRWVEYEIEAGSEALAAQQVEESHTVLKSTTWARSNQNDIAIQHVEPHDGEPTTGFGRRATPAMEKGE